MPETMSRTERIQATLKRQATDRPPVSFWRHFYRRELAPDGLADAMIDWQRTYDWDFVKLNARASYHVEDWGNRYRFSDNDRDPHELDWYRVQEAGEWRRLEGLKPTAGVLGEHLRAIRLVRRGVGPDVPVLMTVFTPLSIAGRLAGGDDRMREYLARNPKEVEAALERITEVFAGFAAECLNAGADGLFFATTTWATTDALPPQDYERWGRPYDLRVLEAVQGATFNILHVCARNNILKALLDYPVHAFNWDAADPTNPGLGEVAGLAEGAVIGGITPAKTADEGRREELLAEAAAARAATGSRGWILGAGCVLPTDAREANLRALRAAVGAL